MNNVKYIRNLMYIHREFHHLVTDETKSQFDDTITAAILALDKCSELSDEEVEQNKLSEVYQGSTQKRELSVQRDSPN